MCPDNGQLRRVVGIYPMKTKGAAGKSLNTFVSMFGIPDKVITDSAKEEFYGEWHRVRKY